MSTHAPQSSSEFLRLLLEAQPQIYAFIRAQVVDRHDAEDIYQDTVTTLWTKFDEFEEGTNFRAWALATARFKLLHYYRERKVANGYSPAVLEAIASEAETAANDAEPIKQALAQCLTKLRAADRDVFQRCYATDATIAQVASQLQRPVSTIKSVLSRSRRSLYECINKTLTREGRK